MVSVIVPVYNGENSLHHCIDSILQQSYQDFELVLVDDGSSDRSSLICDEYANKDNRIFVIHKKNAGVSSARNCGIKASNGDYICFVDVDDMIENDYLSTLVNSSLDQQSELVVCGFFVEENGLKKDSIVFSDEESLRIHRNHIFYLSEKHLFSAPWCKLFKSCIIKDNNLFFDEDMSLGEDIVFNFDYLNFCEEIYVINKCLYHYSTDNTNSLSRRYRKDLLLENRKMNKKLIDYIDIWKLSDEESVPFFRMYFSQFEHTIANTFNNNNKKDSFFDKIKYSNHIIKSAEFKMAYSKFPCKIPFYKKMSYSVNNYLPIYLINKIKILLKRLLKKSR